MGRTKGSEAPTLRDSSLVEAWRIGPTVAKNASYVTPGYRLIALNAKTGNPVPAFGKGGVVDLKLDDDQTIDLITG